MSDLTPAAEAATPTPVETPAPAAPEASEPTAFDQLFALADKTSAPAPAEPAPQAHPPAAPAAPAQQTPPQEPKTVPLPELLTERQKRQESERAAAEAKADADRKQAALDALLSRLGQPQQVQQQPQTEPIQIPDPVHQPYEFAQYQAAVHRAELTRVQSDTDMRFTEAKHGREAMDAAVAAARQAGAIDQFVNRPDGWTQLMAWHSRERVLQEVGTDPNAYRERLKAELLAELKQQIAPAAPQPVAQDPQVQRQPQIPPLLINAGPQGSAGQAAAVTDGDWFTDAFTRR